MSLASFSIGRALERIGETNVNAPYESLALAAMKKYEIPVSYIHSDTTTVSFSGEYDIEGMNLTPEEKEELLIIEKGYNKDGRPGDAQMVIGQMVSGQMVSDTGIPLTCKALDGAAPDVEWNREALDYFDQLREHGFEQSV